MSTAAGDAAGWRVGPVFRVPLWGTLWGGVAAVWLVGPLLLCTQDLHPDGVVAWVIVGAAVLVGGGGLGCLLSMPLALGLGLWPLLRWRPYREPDWALGLATGPLLVCAYLVLSAGIRWFFIRNIGAVAPGRLPLAAGLVLAGGTLGVLGVYRRLLASPSPPGPRALARSLVVATVLGMVALPLRLAPSEASAVGGVELVRRPDGPAARPPFLLVGIDSANWVTLRPLLAEGRLPILARLLAGGVQGDVEALWPPYWSVPAWAAIVTGHTPDENGWHGDMSFEAPGLPPFQAALGTDLALYPFYVIEWALVAKDVLEFTHPPRRVLRYPPIWELLSHSGVETAVMRFDFTYPAADQARFVVSNRVGRDGWSFGGLSRPARDAVVTPAAAKAGLLVPFAGPPDEASLATVLPRPDGPRPHDARVDVFAVLRLAFDNDRRIMEASERLVRARPDLPALMVYLPGFDEACHAFWQYRFPEEYGAARPTPAEVAELGPVIDRYLEYLDGALGRLLAAYGSQPNVVIVSDHGHRAVVDHALLWRAWHDPHAIFIGSGPAFQHRDQPLVVSYFDIVPTIADLLGFEPPAGSRGRSVLR